MIISALLLCEGIVQDGRGSHVLVGTNMNVKQFKSFPAVVNAQAFVLIDDDQSDLTPGSKLYIRVSVTAPDGTSSRVARGEIEAGERLYPQLPGNIALGLPISFEAEQPGTYSVTCEVTTDSTEIDRSTNLYVLATPPHE